jgi:hypothetical protein
MTLICDCDHPFNFCDDLSDHVSPLRQRNSDHPDLQVAQNLGYGRSRYFRDSVCQWECEIHWRSHIRVLTAWEFLIAIWPYAC